MSPSVLTQSAVPIPSSQRCEPGSVNLHIAKWPKTNLDGPVNADTTARGLVSSINNYLGKTSSKEAAEGVASLFLDDECYWRDHLALSWDLKTIKGKEEVLSFLQDNLNLTHVSVDTSTEWRSPRFTPFNVEQTSKGILFYITIGTKVGSGHGVVRLVQDGKGEWKIWTFFTALEELKGFEEPIGPRRVTGAQHGYHRGRKNWTDRRNEEMNFIDREPDVLVIGAGQAGLTVHARLKMLNVPTLIIDSNKRIGDNWRKRYHQLVLHDPIWFDHLPYLRFPDWWPIFTPKDKLADFFESYAKLLELNVWMQTALKSATWDSSEKRWEVTVERVLPDGKLETRTIHPRHVIQSTGHSGKANMPDIKGWDLFRGLICHSSQFPGAKPNGKGKKAIVIGACNSSHDICQDYYENGYEITMVQRSSTCVASSESICHITLAGQYEEGGPPTDDADLLAWSTPAEVLKAAHYGLTKVQQQRDKATIDGLTKAGFKVDKGPDDCGMYIKYFQRGGGYYIDVGASQLIVDGKIKVKQGQEVTEVLPHGLKFADGTELEADEIVFATGYQNMRTQARAIFGDKVADELGDVWGFDQNGEFRTLWRNSGHPGFWFHGGNLAVCRYYSRVLALQIKAQIEGLA
ncbi:putative indole-3-pyruvate monooxygenase YUCCA10 [Cytospora mali]|uniref:Indole-3-pyruvate monooxygenase YUCCA10 n=1 Tax=Cytospora mali TaxID=578113 RepID=A0A194VF51_CYTMA|nr:putative indole-3-pyruvate monooxygenase YUCCA10 [Valsa mali var. pyri (nom. inval.)]